MKILHINSNYVATTLHQLMNRGLEAAGCQNTVYVPIHRAFQPVIQPDGNVTVSRCFRKWDRLVFDYKQHKLLGDVQRKLSVEDFDGIHAYTLFTDGNCARRLSKKYGIPYAVAVRNTDVNGFFRKMPWLRSRGVKILLDARAVFFLSESYRDQVLGRYVPEKYHTQLLEKTRIVPNGIDDFWFQNRASAHVPDPKAPRLIFAGRIDKNKNIPAIQAAMEHLSQWGYAPRLTVVGRAADRELAEQISRDPRTRVLPPVSKEELLPLYRQSDLFVMPSFTESFGLVYGEAMSQGLPVIYTRGQGFDGQFPQGQVGYAVDPNDPEEIARAVERILENYSSVSAAAADGIEKFSWDGLCPIYAATYKELF